MFKAYRLSSPDEIEFYPYNAPNIRGIGRVMRCFTDPRYVFYWKKLTRDEGFALMKLYPGYVMDFAVSAPDNLTYSRSTYLYVPGLVDRAMGPKNMPQPIRLWREKGGAAWVKERVDIMLDKWAGAEPAKTAVEWVDQCTARIKEADVMMDFGFQLWLQSTDSMKANRWLRDLFQAQKPEASSRMSHGPGRWMFPKYNSIEWGTSLLLDGGVRGSIVPRS